jgi:hypothetical protein
VLLVAFAFVAVEFIAKQDKPVSHKFIRLFLFLKYFSFQV